MNALARLKQGGHRYGAHPLPLRESVSAFYRALLLAALLVIPAVALLAEDQATVQPSSPLGALTAAKPLSADELDGHRAKTRLKIDKIQINEQEVVGIVRDNVAIDNETGANNINGKAFSNASGYIGAIQNTGNNVLIQSSTIINVAVEN